MGYYNQTPNNPDYQSRTKKGSKVGYFFSGLIGVIVGALLVYFIITPLSNRPDSDVANNSSNQNNITQNERMSVDVTTGITEAVDKTASTVVGVTNIQTTVDFWTQSKQTQEAGTGSGVIYKKSGDKAYVVTNHHVINGAQQIEVTLSNGSKEEAKLVGSDVWTDLAVLEIDSSKVEAVAQFGDSDALKIGESVIAIGNPLGMSFSGSVTAGVISGKERAVPVDIDANGTEDWQAEVLQTDAAINPGNSGGALINMAGQLVGINSMKIAESAVEGIGFAIPINSAIPVIDSLEKFGEMKRPTMGITLMDLVNIPEVYQRETLKLPEDITTGVIIHEVLPNTPASKAGLQKYDLIVEMDGQKIDNMLDLRKHLYTEKKIGDTMEIKVYRGGKEVNVTMTLTDNATM